MSSSSSSPCAACKLLRRKCTSGCLFAPYFPPDQPRKFAGVHRIYRTSNVAKMLNELSPSQREDAVNSLAFEAEARLLDPVYGCVGYIWLLHHKIKQMQGELRRTEMQLSAYRSSPSSSTAVASGQAMPACLLIESGHGRRQEMTAGGEGRSFEELLLLQQQHSCNPKQQQAQQSESSLGQSSIFWGKRF